MSAVQAPLPSLVDFDHPYGVPAAQLTSELGGKGAHLAEMAGALGLPVPPGFTVTTAACGQALESGDVGSLEAELVEAVGRLERHTGRTFGGDADPLLVSVRSGAPASMPGMMDTVLNVGLTRRTVLALARRTGDAAFAWDSYRRLAQMYAASVLGASVDLAVAAQDAEREHPDLAARLATFDGMLAATAPLPDDPWEQLHAAVAAVIGSWSSERARTYRRIEGIPERPCTAVTVQAMVFGNRGRSSGSGVAFTRDPSSGEPVLVGDWLAGAQGEDVVAGTHRVGTLDDLAREMPRVAGDLAAVARVLELRLCDMCDIEFTVERGTLWLLQVRVGKRTPRAALRIAIDQASDSEMLIDRAEAVRRVAHLLADPPRDTPRLDSLVASDRLFRGVGASPGTACGRAYFNPDDVVAAAERGESAVLVRQATSPADVHGLAEAVAVVTATGGMMSHAAVVARSWGIPAVVGVEELEVDATDGRLGGTRIQFGAWITVDGTSGAIAVGRVEVDSEPVPETATLVPWAEELGITFNAQPVAPAAGVQVAATIGERGPPLDVAEGVLVVLAIRSLASADALAETLLADPAAVEATLADLEAAGRAALRGRGWRLTAEGARAAAAAFERHRDVVAASGGQDALLEDFDGVNRELKAVVSAWQLREVDGEPVPNDHADVAYDANVLDRLRVVHAHADSWLAALDETVPYAGLYRRRLRRALRLVEAGDEQWLLSPLVDSFHSVWFELHEHLIYLAGRTRADEAAAGRA